MRASPRTWPSMRLSRLRQPALISLRMRDRYPYGVRVSSRQRREGSAMSKPTQAREHAPLRAAGSAASGEAYGSATCSSHHHPATPPATAPAADSASTVDPVCGMKVDPHATAHRHSYQGRTYHFCSAGCLSKFAANPTKYLGAESGKAPEPILEGTIYTCPMH